MRNGCSQNAGLQSECSAAAGGRCVCLVLNCLGVGNKSNVFMTLCVSVHLYHVQNYLLSTCQVPLNITLS